MGKPAVLENASGILTMQTKGLYMNSQLNSVISGFLFGIGMILAAALMKTVLHLGFCG